MEKDPFDFELEGRVVLLGIGNKSRGDDGAGVKVIERIRGEINSEQVLLIDAGITPEKFTSKVKNFNPDCILLIDSVDIGEGPGTVSIVDPEGIVEDTISTHRLPLSILMEYLKKETGGEVLLVGIQPARVGIGSKMSSTVSESVEFLAKLLVDKLD